MEEITKIEVTIERATEIPIISSLSKTVSPYVLIKWKNNEPKRTGIAHTNQNPVYNQVFVLETDDPSDVVGFPLILEIFDHNKIGKDSLIGTCSIMLMTLYKFDQGTKINFKIPIFHQTRGYSGTISFSVSCIAGRSLMSVLPIRIGEHEKGLHYIPWGIIEETTSIAYKDDTNLSDDIQLAICQCLDKINMKTSALGGKIISGIFAHHMFIDGPKQYIIVRVVGTVLSDEEIDKVNEITITTSQDTDESFSVFCPVFSSRVFVIATTNQEEIENLFVAGWAQLRQDLRQQAIFYHCDLVHGYKEHFTIDGSTVIISALGTVCKSNTSYLSVVPQDIPQPSIFRPNSQEKIMIRATASIKRPQALALSDATAPFSFACTSAFDGSIQSERTTKMINKISAMYEEATKQISDFLDTTKYDSLFDLDIGITIKGQVIFLWITGTATCLKEITDALLIHSAEKPPAAQSQVKWSIEGSHSPQPSKPLKKHDEETEEVNINENIFTEKGLPTIACIIRDVNVTTSTMAPSDFVSSQINHLSTALSDETHNLHISNLAQDFFFEKPGHLVAVSQCSYMNTDADKEFHDFAITKCESIDGYKIVNNLGIVQYITQRSAIRTRNIDDGINAILNDCYEVLESKAKARGANAIVNAKIEFPKFVTSRSEGIDFIICVIYGDAVAIEPTA